MPCRSDYLESNDREKELSRVYQLLDEIQKGKKPGKNYGDGYDKRAYCKASQDHLDVRTRELCGELKKQENLGRFSLEMQLWWRDHLKADQRHKIEEDRERKKTKLKQQALAKLSKAEKKALGL